MSHDRGMRESQIRLKAIPATPDDPLKRKVNPVSTVKTAAVNEINHYVKPVAKPVVNPANPSKQNDKFETIRDPQSSMVYLVDLIFDFLQFYADDANSLNRGTSMQLDWQRPILEKQSASHSRSWLTTTPELPAFVGKLLTRDWSLFIKGTSTNIMFYVIPANRTISFTTDPELYTPYLSINFYKRRADFAWQIDDKRITSQHIPALAKTLLEKLLKCARNQVCQLSAFSLKALDVQSLPDSESNLLPEIENRIEAAPVDHKQFLQDLKQTEKSINNILELPTTARPANNLDLPNSFENNDFNSSAASPISIPEPSFQPPILEPSDPDKDRPDSPQPLEAKRLKPQNQAKAQCTEKQSPEPFHMNSCLLKKH